jgi:TorA maturation chaperone TorD
MATAVTDLRSYESQEGVVEEDRARANIYGLLANLFYGPPSEALLRDIATIDSDVDRSPLAGTWHTLQQAARNAEPGALRQEYDNTFITAGRAPVFLYGSVYQTGFLMDKPLAQLRDDLAKIGLARNLEIGEPEDHISALCDVMRFLIAGAEEIPASDVALQREFFMRHIAPWYDQVCTAVENAEQTDFYKKVAAFAKEFFDLEVQSFEIA